MRKIQRKYRKLLKNDENCIIIETHPNNVKKITIELDSATPSDQSDLFVFSNGQVEKIGKIKKISDKEIKGEKEDKNMEPVNILDAANFLIQLYYKTTRISEAEDYATTNDWSNDKDNSKYRCTCTHIEKLLVIANLIAYKNGLTLIEHDMLANKCGVGIPILRDFLYSTIVNGISDKQIIPEDRIDDHATFPDSYTIKGDFYEKTQKILKDVFLRFGAYDARAIGTMFDEFKQRIVIPNLRDEGHPLISLELSYQYFQSDNVPTNILQNEIFNYIKNYVI